MSRNKDIVEGILLDDNATYTVVELSKICVTDQDTIVEMVEYGIIAPLEPKAQAMTFSGDAITRLQKALRLHHDLSINWPGISLALELLDEIEDLRAELENLKKL